MPQGPTLDPRLLAREPSNFLANAIQSGVGGFMQGRQLRLQEEQMDMAREEAELRGVLTRAQIERAKLENQARETEVAAEDAKLTIWRQQNKIPSFEDFQAGSVESKEVESSPMTTLIASFDPQNQAQYNGLITALREASNPADLFANLSDADQLLAKQAMNLASIEVRNLGSIQDTTSTAYQETLRRVAGHQNTLDSLMKGFGTNLLGSITDEQGRNVANEILAETTLEIIRQGIPKGSDRDIVAGFANRVGITVSDSRTGTGRPVRANDFGNPAMAAEIMGKVAEKYASRSRPETTPTPTPTTGTTPAPVTTQTPTATLRAIETIEALTSTLQDIDNLIQTDRGRTLGGAGGGGRSELRTLDFLDL